MVVDPSAYARDDNKYGITSHKVPLNFDPFGFTQGRQVLRLLRVDLRPWSRRRTNPPLQLSPFRGERTPASLNWRAVL